MRFSPENLLLDFVGTVHHDANLSLEGVAILCLTDSVSLVVALIYRQGPYSISLSADR